jgi:hypothetical protein
MDPQVLNTYIDHPNREFSLLMKRIFFWYFHCGDTKPIAVLVVLKPQKYVFLSANQSAFPLSEEVKMMGILWEERHMLTINLGLSDQFSIVFKLCSLYSSHIV